MYRQAFCGLILASALLATGCECMGCKKWTLGNPMFSSARRCDVAPQSSFYWVPSGPANSGCGPCNGGTVLPAAPAGSNFSPAPGFGATPPPTTYPAQSNAGYQPQQQQQVQQQQQYQQHQASYPPPPLPPYNARYRNDYVQQ